MCETVLGAREERLELLSLRLLILILRQMKYQMVRIKYTMKIEIEY